MMTVSTHCVLVTGANGFIGQHVCRALAEEGKEVIGCLRNRTEASALNAIPGVRVQIVSSLDAEAEMAPVLASCDAVVHLAGRAHIMHDTAPDPLAEFRRVNVGMTAALATMAARAGIRRFLLASSIKVNGEATNGRPFCADDPPAYCDPYGQSKWEAEEKLREIADASGMEWVAVRPPLVYGPGVRANFFALLRAVYRGVPLPMGGVHNRRSLVSVYNLSDFISCALTHPAAAGNRFFVADAEDISTPELIRAIARSMNRTARLLPIPESILRAAASALGRRALVKRLCSSLTVDREKAKTLLGWTAPLALDAGLSRTAEWFLHSSS
jgi:nucleoside-diphosphate-sugar epimerase